MLDRYCLEQCGIESLLVDREHFANYRRDLAWIVRQLLSFHCSVDKSLQMKWPLLAIKSPDMLPNHLRYNDSIEEKTSRTVVIDYGSPELILCYWSVY